MGASPETVSAGSGKERYHHGGLREALIEAAETLLDERGVEGFSMREAARRAGVSSAAHAHHFKDARGLLTAVAAAAFTRFGEALESASDSPDLKHRLRQQALAYLRFALRERARFQLMWRVDLIDRASADYSGAVQKATRVLANARSDGSPHPGENEPTIDVERRIARQRSRDRVGGSGLDPRPRLLDAGHRWGVR